MIDIDVSPEITTDRLRLRATQPDDALRIARLANDPDVGRMTTRMPYPYDLGDAETFLARASENDQAKEAVFAIERAGCGLVGLLGFHPNAQGRTEIGYWLGRPHWAKGYATEAVRAALVWAREGWLRRLVVAGHFADNAASGAVLCKAGFLYTGEVQSHYSLARGGPAPTRMMVWLA